MGPTSIHHVQWVLQCEKSKSKTSFEDNRPCSSVTGGIQRRQVKAGPVQPSDVERGRERERRKGWGWLLWQACRFGSRVIPPASLVLTDA